MKHRAAHLLREQIAAATPARHVRMTLVRRFLDGVARGIALAFMAVVGVALVCALGWALMRAIAWLP